MGSKGSEKEEKERQHERLNEKDGWRRVEKGRKRKREGERAKGWKEGKRKQTQGGEETQKRRRGWLSVARREGERMFTATPDGGQSV